MQRSLKLVEGTRLQSRTPEYVRQRHWPTLVGLVRRRAYLHLPCSTLMVLTSTRLTNTILEENNAIQASTHTMETRETAQPLPIHRAMPRTTLSSLVIRSPLLVTPTTRLRRCISIRTAIMLCNLRQRILVTQGPEGGEAIYLEIPQIY